MSSAVEQETTAVVIREEASGSIAAFASVNNYEAAKRMATALSQSTIVPDNYRNSIANCLVAMELASRTRASVMMVMQNLHIIKGRPSWSAAFLIASVNSCGRFTPLRYEVAGTPSTKGWKCRAVAREIATGDVLEGEWITWEMVLGEGWLNKDGSKWKTMPGQMIRYRAASFWTRTYAPEISLGMHTSDEAEDIGAPPLARGTATRDLNAALRVASSPDQAKEIDVSDMEVVDEAAEAAAQAVAPPKSAAASSTKCSVCFRTDGTHDPDAPCYEEQIRREDAELARAEEGR